MENLGLNAMFGGVYSGRRVLITGHTGFKGSWLTAWMQALGGVVAGFSLPPETGPSHWRNLGLAIPAERLSDLTRHGEIDSALSEFRPDIVFHLAAQSLVRRSYRDPARTYQVNVSGLVALLEAVRKCDSVRAVVNVTTDKVYEPPAPPSGYAEGHPLGGHDPYSASKACAEIITSSYQRSFFSKAAVAGSPTELACARAGNVIGGGDWAEDRLVPDLVRAIMRGEPLALRNPMATRPWQHVLEPLSGYLELGRRLLIDPPAQRAWNFGPDDGDVLAVKDVVAGLAKHWPTLEVAGAEGPHPHEAAELVLDSTQARRALGWRPVWKAPEAIDRTARWYKAFLAHGDVLTLEDLAAYCDDARRLGLTWAG